MEIIDRRERGDLGTIHVARLRADRGSLVEFVDTRDPRHPVEEKWVAIISTQFGCAVKCLFCDAGGGFRGNLTAAEMLALVDRLVMDRYGGRRVPVPKWKLHFARMGEPSLNPAVPEVLRELAGRYEAPGLIPTIPTVAAAAGEAWFEEVARIKEELYGGGRFQLQFSANSTDEAVRDRLMPVKKWSLERIAAFGRRWFRPGDRKLTLNFALSPDFPFDREKVQRLFDPERFLLKFTPVNPTEAAAVNGIGTVLSCSRRDALDELAAALEGEGFQVLISIGEESENELGTNCGQAAFKALREEMGAAG